MSQELLLQSITAIYAVCNAARLLSYVPQIVAVARECSGAHALSLISWTFWSFSHAVTAIYCATVVDDALLAGMMWGNAIGCAAVVALTTIKRRQYGWRPMHHSPRTDALTNPHLAHSRAGRVA
jgi:hypothetical protein